jgi:hypothetical protein
MIQKLKDLALSHGARVAMNQYISEYGEIVKLNLNSKFKTMDMEIMLDGEDECINIQVEHYEITEENTLRISCVTTSKAWITTLAHTCLEGKTFDVTDEYAKMLRAVI